VPWFRRRSLSDEYVQAMAINPRAHEGYELASETARAQFLALQADPNVDDNTKLIAAAIAQAGAAIAIAIETERDGLSSIR
jgi:hypothetical protein